MFFFSGIEPVAFRVRSRCLSRTRQFPFCEKNRHESGSFILFLLYVRARIVDADGAVFGGASQSKTVAKTRPSFRARGWAVLSVELREEAARGGASRDLFLGLVERGLEVRDAERSEQPRHRRAHSP